jgi:negative regulator of sigma E activity
MLASHRRRFLASLRPVLRIVGATAVCVTVLFGVLLTLQLTGRSDERVAPDVAATPAATVQTPATAPVRPADDTADHALFNPSATLDTTLIDDLRADPEARRLADGGVPLTRIRITD